MAKTEPPKPMAESASLDEGGKKQFNTCVGIPLYISPDRPDIQRDVQLLCRKMHDPTEWDHKRLVRVIRYLMGTRCWGTLLKKPKTKVSAHSKTVTMDMYTEWPAARQGGEGHPLSAPRPG